MDLIKLNMKSWSSLVTAVPLVVLFLLAAAPVASSGQTAHLVTKEKSLGRLLPGADLNSLTADPSFQRVAYVVQRGQKELSVVDGVEGREYDASHDHPLCFSPDGKRLVYLAKRGDKMLVEVDGVEAQPYDSIDHVFAPIFSPDSRQVAYIAGNRSSLRALFGMWDVTERAVVDGKELTGYQQVEGLVFSPDSKKLAYCADAKWNQGTSVVVDGVEGKPFDQITGVHFSPDSTRLAFVAFQRPEPKARGLNFAVIDGNEGPKYESVPTVEFSPDSKHTAYRAGNKEKLIVRDNVPGPSYTTIEDGPIFSPDSKRLAYIVRSGGNLVVVVDDKALYDCRPCQLARELVFSPDSQHIAYMTRVNEHWYTVLDGTEVPNSKDSIIAPHFSVDGKRLAYIKKGEHKRVLVYGDLESAEYDRFVECRPIRNIGGLMSFRAECFAFGQQQVVRAIALRGDEIVGLEFRIASE